MITYNTHSEDTGKENDPILSWTRADGKEYMLVNPGDKPTGLSHTRLTDFDIARVLSAGKRTKSWSAFHKTEGRWVRKLTMLSVERVG